MAGRPAPRQDLGPERQAAWSAIAGLLTMVVVIVLSERLSSGQRASGDTALGALGASVALAAPFLAALATLFVRDVEVRDGPGRGTLVIARMARHSILVSLFLALTLSSNVSARQATPVASPTAIDVGECTTEPRSNDEMRALIEAGLPPVVAFMAGTPIAEGTPRPQAVDGEPADEATVAAVSDVIMQWVACQNDGELLAVAALMTEEGTASYLSFGFISFRSLFTGGVGTPTAEIDPTQVDLYLGAMQLGVPLPPDLLPTLYGIESVTQLDDGRVQVIVLVANGSEEPRQISILFREEDGRYRMVFGRDTGVEAPITPVP